MCRNFLPANLDYDERDERGDSLMYRINDAFFLCCENFLGQHASSVDERYRQMIKTYMRVYLEGQIAFVTYVEAQIRKSGKQNNTIVVEANHLNSTLTAFYADRGLSVKSVFNFTKVLRNAYLIPLVHVVNHLMAKLRPDPVRNNIGVIRPATWIEYSDNRYSMDRAWRQHLHAGSFDVVHYFDLRDNPLTEARTSKLERQGFKWIDLQTSSLCKLGNVSASMLMGMLVDLFASGRPCPPWFKAFQLQEKMWYHSYLAVFRKFQVKVVIQYQDRDWRQAVQAHAVEDAGGIMIGFHHSNLPHCMDAWFLNSQHVYFVWGQAMYESLKRKGHTCRYILPSGFWLKPASEERPIKLNELDHDLDFVMSVFDSDVGHSCQMSPTQTPESLSAFFLFILDQLEANPRWGVILKSKFRTFRDYESILPGGMEIVERMQRLVEQKRLVELESSVFPVMAAANSNLAVCYALNSAGIVSALFGYPAVHWDSAGLRHPLYSNPDQQIVFRTLEGLSQSIQRAARGDKSVGDFSRWVKDYNYFCDFRGDMRVAMFIQAYMEEAVVTCSPEHSLASAVGRYNTNNQILHAPFEGQKLNVQ